MPNVAFKRPELVSRMKEYELIRDAIGGETTVKYAKGKYLPVPGAHDNSPANVKRYQAYLTRAVFYNVTARTVTGFVGQMFQDAPVLEVPTALQPIADDVDGQGVSLIQLAKRVASWVVPYGRSGLFVDYPATDGMVTREQVEAAGIRPTIAAYEPWNIINWRTLKRGALTVNAMVVLEEDYIKSDDGFEIKFDKEWRVLILDAITNTEQQRTDYAYRVEVYRKDAAGNFTVNRRARPLKADGTPFDAIPFVFVGSENNDSNVDPCPMYDLASVNMAHYRNSADYEESIFLLGQPTPVITGLTESWADKYFKEGVPLGARSAVPLPTGGDAKLLQAEPNTMAKEGMDAKELQMVALGAKLAEKQEVQRTATEARQEEAAEQSVISTISNNISLAFVWALGWAADYIGIAEAGVKFKINPDLEISNIGAEERKQIIAEWQAGAISFTEMRLQLRKAGSATQPDEKAKTEIDAEQAATREIEQENIEPIEESFA